MSPSVAIRNRLLLRSIAPVENEPSEPKIPNDKNVNALMAVAPMPRSAKAEELAAIPKEDPRIETIAPQTLSKPPEPIAKPVPILLRDPATYKAGKTREVAFVGEGGRASIVFCWCPPGTSIRKADNQKERSVKIAQGYWMAQTEITQAQWRAVMKTSPSKFPGDARPVEQVSWDESATFCKELQKLTGMPMRLPAEAEWEYACQAGTNTDFFSGDRENALNRVGWYLGNSDKEHHTVAEKGMGNDWRLHDMHGNVAEWCQDWFGPLKDGEFDDIEGPIIGVSKVTKGGSYLDIPSSCQSSYRREVKPQRNASTIGLRVCYRPVGPEEIAIATAELAPAKPKEPIRAIPKPDLPIVSQAYAHRFGKVKDDLLKSRGASEASEEAVANGLVWLAKQQRQDGSWTYDGEHKEDTISATGLSLLPFLAAGHTHKAGTYKGNVKKGLDYLLRNLSVNGPTAGRFNSRSACYMYVHGIATIALCEAYGMTKDRAYLLLPAQAAINYMQKAQALDGSWGYQPNTPGDTSIVGWQIQALKAAQLAKDIVVDDKVIRAAMKFLDKVSTGPRKSAYGYAGPNGKPATSLTAVGLLSRYYMDGWGPGNGAMSEGIEGLMTRAPKESAGQLGDMYFYYYATQVVHFSEGPEWRNWNEGAEAGGQRTGGMRDLLIALQKQGRIATGGSWDPDGAWIGKDCGRLGTTCFCLLSLEIYYRHATPVKRAIVDAN